MPKDIEIIIKKNSDLWFKIHKNRNERVLNWKSCSKNALNATHIFGLCVDRNFSFSFYFQCFMALSVCAWVHNIKCNNIQFFHILILFVVGFFFSSTNPIMKNAFISFVNMHHQIKNTKWELKKNLNKNNVPNTPTNFIHFKVFSG